MEGLKERQGFDFAADSLAVEAHPTRQPSTLPDCPARAAGLHQTACGGVEPLASNAGGLYRNGLE